MQSGSLQQLLIFNFPNVLIRPTGHIRHELAKPPIRIPMAQVGNGGQKIVALFAVHGKQSLILGILVTSTCGNS